MDPNSANWQTSSTTVATTTMASLPVSQQLTNAMPAISGKPMVGYSGPPQPVENGVPWPPQGYTKVRPYPPQYQYANGQDGSMGGNPNEAVPVQYSYSSGNVQNISPAPNPQMYYPPQSQDVVFTSGNPGKIRKGNPKSAMYSSSSGMPAKQMIRGSRLTGIRNGMMASQPVYSAPMENQYYAPNGQKMMPQYVMSSESVHQNGYRVRPYPVVNGGGPVKRLASMAQSPYSGVIMPDGQVGMPYQTVQGTALTNQLTGPFYANNGQNQMMEFQGQPVQVGTMDPASAAAGQSHLPPAGMRGQGQPMPRSTITYGSLPNGMEASVVPQRFTNGTCAGGDVTQQHMPFTQPYVPPHDTEPCLTLPQREDPLIPPFKLQHNLQMSQHTFSLNHQVHQALMSNTGLELELKCYNHDDPFRRANWPDAISVSVNGVPVGIQRAHAPRPHRPLYIKQLCHPGNKNNVITITATACCCSHLFLLHIVHRPTVRSVVQHVLRKQVLPTSVFIEKLNRMLVGGNRGFSGNELAIPLRCPLTKQRLSIPARSNQCPHLHCFDLENFLLNNKDQANFRCLLCPADASVENLQVDEFLFNVLKHLASPNVPDGLLVDQIVVDTTGQWRPVFPDVRQAEGMQYKTISPGRASLPWEAHMVHTPGSDVPRSLSTGRSSTPRGPASVGSILTNSSDYGSPASVPALVPVSPAANRHGFPNSVPACPQKSPTPSLKTETMTPVPQMPHTPGATGVQQCSNNPLDFLDLNFDPEPDADNDTLQFLADMSASELLSFLDGGTGLEATTLPLDVSAADLDSAPLFSSQSAGTASDSGISVLSAPSSAATSSSGADDPPSNADSH